MGQETEPTRAAGEAAVEETLAYASAVEAAPPSISLQIGVTWRDTIDGVMQTGAKWDKARVAWAASGAVAATAIAPLLTTVNAADVYVDAETILGLEAAAAAAGLRPIEGGRLTLRPFPSVTARRLATRVDGLMVCAMATRLCRRANDRGSRPGSRRTSRGGHAWPMTRRAVGPPELQPNAHRFASCITTERDPSSRRPEGRCTSEKALGLVAGD